ncbi:MAG: hypothetical protein ACI9BW_004439 [Gammaproteobacteria bacterium]|jgi:hypothetical protein
MVYPVQGDPGASYTKVYHYAAQHIGAEITGDGALYDVDSEMRVEFNQAAVEELADRTVEDEDYWVGTMTQKSANSGKIEYFVLGRNEPGIPHMHQAYRVGLGLPPLDEYRPSSRLCQRESGRKRAFAVV